MVKVSTKRKKDIEIPSEIKDEIKEFSAHYKKLKKLAKRQHVDPELVSQELTKTLLAMSIEMLPRIEDTFHTQKGAKGIYGIVALTNQMRELASDLRALDDRSQVSQQVIADVIEPNLKTVAQAFNSEINSIKRVATEHLDRKTCRKIHAACEGAADSFFERLQGIRQAMDSRTISILEG